MPKKQQPLEQLEQRWRNIFGSLAAGGEVPPARRLRTEGMMEALVMLELTTEAELQEAMAVCYEACFKEALQSDWRELFPFPQIPGFGQRAPVYPSTGD
jgi:hypothetical protein